MADPVNPPGAPSARGRDARARLLDAAVQAFAARGFHGTTTRDIASAAGMSPAALYVHYGSKEELLHEISLAGHRTALGICEQAVAASEQPAEQLRVLVRDFVRHHAANNTVARIVNYELGALAPEHRAEIDGLRHAMDMLVRDLVRRGVRDGEFDTPEPAVTGAALLSLGIDVSRWYAAGGWSPDQVADHYAELALRMVGASGSSPG
ncbi:TetR/AcrR family transcriptional regulator [Nocardioides campestrisoli]|uniref:TetR/AcrR family transcriptional regulator n=1 Tax=Nocardioides campestrisoli TaxID=2736757 RepID=UPI00163D4B86|nr:TetR/AcrR family transcriptional regulator [Nocardioides campestrisoli]